MQFGWNQLWGIGVIVVGVIWIISRSIPVGFRSRPTSFYVEGKWAVMLGIFAILLGIAVVFEIPKQIKIDKCLDSGGKYNYETNECIGER